MQKKALTRRARVYEYLTARKSCSPACPRTRVEFVLGRAADVGCEKANGAKHEVRTFNQL